MTRPPLEQQIDYYRQRASEYDEWILRQGRYDRGAAHRAQWNEEMETVAQALTATAPGGKILELACGTGLWTHRLVEHADSVTAVDASPEALAINRDRGGAGKVRHVVADLFSWRPDDLYDLVFFGFWLSHVPPDRFAAFWDLVEAALAPAGRVFFVDSLYTAASTARDQELGAESETTVRRRLKDGREFDIVKVFYRPAPLQARLEQIGWNITVRGTPSFFLYGHGGRAPSGASAGSGPKENRS